MDSRHHTDIWEMEIRAEKKGKEEVRDIQRGKGERRERKEQRERERETRGRIERTENRGK
jgi:hypothetical protein